MIDAIQKVSALIGRAGCYFLCILRLAEKLLADQLDVFNCYMLAIACACMKENCFVERPGELLGMIAGGKWQVLKAGDGLDSAGRPYNLPLAYVLQVGEMDIQRWEIPGETEGHFIVSDGWDPYGSSMTVAHGKLVSRRIFRPIL
jgi:hypothetical protein